MLDCNWKSAHTYLLSWKTGKI